MKTKLILTIVIAFTCIRLIGYGQDLPDSGFTNRAEAKNVILHDTTKDGKWIEYLSPYFKIVSDTASAFYYRLIIYNNGKPTGIARLYIRERHMLYIESPYKDGLLNGVEKIHGKGGMVYMIKTYANGKKNGISRIYNDNGTTMTESNYTDGKLDGASRDYYSNGKIKTELIYTNGVAGETKNYDENGNLIKK